MDRELLRGRVAQPIEGKAARQIVTLTQQAIDLAGRWLDLQATRPGASNNFMQRRAQELRQAIDARQQQALAAIEQFESSHSSSLIAGGAKLCRAAIHQIHRLFDFDASWSGAEPKSEYLLGRDLLQIPSITMDDRWAPQVDRVMLTDGILSWLAEEPSSDWQSATRQDGATSGQLNGTGN